jgi:PEGA domain.
MYNHRIRFLFVLLCLGLLCGAVQATNLLITVQDSIDNTTVPHATVYLSGANVGLTNNAGQFLLQSGQGDLPLRVSLDGYDDWSNTVSGNVTTLSVTLVRRTLTLNVLLYDSNTLQPVSGATLDLVSGNSSQSKTSDSNGAATFATTAYSYYGLNISAPNYQPRSDNIEMASKDQNVQYWLLSSNQYSFVVTDKTTRKAIPGASISVDSVLLGTTDSRGVLTTSLSRGKSLSIEIKKDGYQTVNQLKTISSSEAVDAVELTSVPVGAFVFIYDKNNQPVNGAEVSIDNAVVATSNSYGRATLSSMTPGSYTIVVKKSGYSPVTQTITIVNESSEFPVILSLSTVSQTIYVQDTDQKNIAGATVLLNGASAGTTDTRGQLDTQLVYGTPYNITATADGYRAKSVQQTVSIGNATAPLTITLEKNLDMGFLTMIGLVILVVIVLVLILRIVGRRAAHHSSGRRDEI